MHVREFRPSDIPQMIRIWNEVVVDGIAFPQEDALDLQSGTAFFAEQTHCSVVSTTTRWSATHPASPQHRSLRAYRHAPLQHTAAQSA